jgi:hypothetical protein
MDIERCLLAAFLIVTLAPIDIVIAESDQIEGGDFQGPGYCLDCHVGPMVDWLGSPHDTASRDLEFQEDMERLGSPESCLSCHTTGFEEEGGTFVYDGVSCEECHGPGDTMNRDVSSELCGSCHSSPFPTYEEWKESGPSHGNATCILCHDEHTTQLTADTSTGTCAICHESHLEDVEASKHGPNDVECADCHMYRSPVDFEEGTPAATGHSFSMTSGELDCSTCHDRPLFKHDVLGEKAFACLSCHGEIHELGLKLVNGSVYAPDDSVALCAQCHNERYTAWEQGTHGKPDDPDAPCTECHDPHDPIISEFPTVQSLPPRVAAAGPSIPLTTAFIVAVELLGFAIIILRWRTSV